MKFIRIPAVIERTGISRPTIDRLERNGLFPLRRHISQRAVGWVEAEVDKWLAQRQAGAGAEHVG